MKSMENYTDVGAMELVCVSWPHKIQPDEHSGKNVTPLPASICARAQAQRSEPAKGDPQQIQSQDKEGKKEKTRNKLIKAMKCVSKEEKGQEFSDPK